MSKVTAGRFTITYRDATYKVSVPNYDGGEVVPAEIADELLTACKAAFVKLKTNPLDRVSVAYEMLSAAIAKAEAK